MISYITQTELALHLCWAIGEHGAGGTSYKDVARVLFENLELLLYENLATRLMPFITKTVISFFFISKQIFVCLFKKKLITKKGDFEFKLDADIL
jgi:hypothetical protein